MKPILLYCLMWIGLIQHDNLIDKINEEINKKNFKEAISLCSAQLTKTKVSDLLYSKYLFLRATCYLEASRYNESITDYKKLAVLNPNDVTYPIGLSYLYGQIKDYNSSVNILKKALTIKGANREVALYNNLSYYLAQTGNDKGALFYADEGLKNASDNYWKGVLLNNKGGAYLVMKKYAEALKFIDEGIKLNSDNSFAYCYRAIANIGLKNMTTVCDDLQKAKQLGGTQLTEQLIKEYCTL